MNVNDMRSLIMRHTAVALNTSYSGGNSIQPQPSRTICANWPSRALQPSGVALPPIGFCMIVISRILHPLLLRAAETMGMFGGRLPTSDRV